MLNYQNRGVDPFFGWGGGGGKSKEKLKNFAPRARSQYKTARKARRKLENCLCFVIVLMLNLMVLCCLKVLFKPIIALHTNFSSCRNYWRAKRYVCHPNISMAGGGGGGGLPLYQNIKHFKRKSHEFSQYLTQTILTSYRYATFMETYASGTRIGTSPEFP